MSVEQKFENFKSFVKEISKNKETVQEYQDMTLFKLQALALVFLIPNKDNLDMVIEKMKEKLEFEDSHEPKFRRYIEFFIEYMSGNDGSIELQADREELTYEQQLDLALKGDL